MQLLTLTTTMTHNIAIGVVAKWINLDIGYTLITKKWTRLHLRFP